MKSKNRFKMTKKVIIFISILCANYGSCHKFELLGEYVADSGHPLLLENKYSCSSKVGCELECSLFCEDYDEAGLSCGAFYVDENYCNIMQLNESNNGHKDMLALTAKSGVKYWVLKQSY